MPEAFPGVAFFRLPQLARPPEGQVRWQPAPPAAPKHQRAPGVGSLPAQGPPRHRADLATPAEAAPSEPLQLPDGFWSAATPPPAAPHPPLAEYKRGAPPRGQQPAPTGGWGFPDEPGGPIVRLSSLRQGLGLAQCVAAARELPSEAAVRLVQLLEGEADSAAEAQLRRERAQLHGTEARQRARVAQQELWHRCEQQRAGRRTLQDLLWHKRAGVEAAAAASRRQGAAGEAAARRELLRAHRHAQLTDAEATSRRRCKRAEKAAREEVSAAGQLSRMAAGARTLQRAARGRAGRRQAAARRAAVATSHWVAAEPAARAALAGREAAAFTRLSCGLAAAAEAYARAALVTAEWAARGPTAAAGALEVAAHAARERLRGEQLLGAGRLLDGRLQSPLRGARELDEICARGRIAARCRAEYGLARVPRSAALPAALCLQRWWRALCRGDLGREPSRRRLSAALQGTPRRSRPPAAAARMRLHRVREAREAYEGELRDWLGLCTAEGLARAAAGEARGRPALEAAEAAERLKLRHLWSFSLVEAGYGARAALQARCGARRAALEAEAAGQGALGAVEGADLAERAAAEQQGVRALERMLVECSAVALVMWDQLRAAAAAGTIQRAARVSAARRRRGSLAARRRAREEARLAEEQLTAGILALSDRLGAEHRTRRERIGAEWLYIAEECARMLAGQVELELMEQLAARGGARRGFAVDESVQRAVVLSEEESEREALGAASAEDRERRSTDEGRQRAALEGQEAVQRFALLAGHAAAAVEARAEAEARALCRDPAAWLPPAPSSPDSDAPLAARRAEGAAGVQRWWRRLRQGREGRAARRVLLARDLAALRARRAREAARAELEKLRRSVEETERRQREHYAEQQRRICDQEEVGRAERASEEEWAAQRLHVAALEEVDAALHQIYCMVRGTQNVERTQVEGAEEAAREELRREHISTRPRVPTARMVLAMQAAARGMVCRLGLRAALAHRLDLQRRLNAQQVDRRGWVLTQEQQKRDELRAEEQRALVQAAHFGSLYRAEGAARASIIADAEGAAAEVREQGAAAAEGVHRSALGAAELAARLSLGADELASRCLAAQAAPRRALAADERGAALGQLLTAAEQLWRAGLSEQHRALMRSLPTVHVVAAEFAERLEIAAEERDAALALCRAQERVGRKAVNAELAAARRDLGAQVLQSTRMMIANRNLAAGVRHEQKGREGLSARERALREELAERHARSRDSLAATRIQASTRGHLARRSTQRRVSAQLERQQAGDVEDAERVLKERAELSERLQLLELPAGRWELTRAQTDERLRLRLRRRSELLAAGTAAALAAAAADLAISEGAVTAAAAARVLRAEGGGVDEAALEQAVERALEHAARDRALLEDLRDTNEELLVAVDEFIARRSLAAEEAVARAGTRLSADSQLAFFGGCRDYAAGAVVLWKGCCESTRAAVEAAEAHAREESVPGMALSLLGEEAALRATETLRRQNDITAQYHLGLLNITEFAADAVRTGIVIAQDSERDAHAAQLAALERAHGERVELAARLSADHAAAGGELCGVHSRLAARLQLERAEGPPRAALAAEEAAARDAEPFAAAALVALQVRGGRTFLDAWGEEMAAYAALYSRPPLPEDPFDRRIVAKRDLLECRQRWGEEQEEVVDSAVVLQSAWRGRATRKELAREAEDRRRAAATVIQSLWRGVGLRARGELGALREQREGDCLDREEAEFIRHNATLIQSAWKSYYVSNHLEELLGAELA